jgi:hypothetical protein
MRLTLSHRCCRALLVHDEDAARDAAFETAPAVTTTPNGPAVAAEAFDWMNRQLTWQSLLADLEMVAWLAEGDAPRWRNDPSQ